MKSEQNLIFQENMDTLHNLSRDTSHNEYMTDSQLLAVNFDEVKRIYCNRHGMSEEKASSADALLQKGEAAYLIEFKNGDARKKKNEIKEKSNESVMIYCDLTEREISDTRRYLEFILVYNEERTRISPAEMKGLAMARISHLPHAIMELDKHEGLCYRRIRTMSREEFDRWLQVGTD